VSTTKRNYRVVIEWQHPNFGPQMEKATATATSIRRAVNGFLMAFFKDPQHHERRRAAHAELEIKIRRMEVTSEPSRMAARSRSSDSSKRGPRRVGQSLLRQRGAKAGRIGPRLESHAKLNNRGENKKQERHRETLEQIRRQPNLFP
jgi:hypothetical protein